VLLGVLFDVENPRKVGEFHRQAFARDETPSGVDRAGESGSGTHDSHIRTDFAGNASSAVTASAGGRDGAGNSRRDTAARTT
jgi:hypothetical protein